MALHREKGGEFIIHSPSAGRLFVVVEALQG